MSVQFALESLSSLRGIRIRQQKWLALRFSKLSIVASLRPERNELPSITHLTM